LSPSCCWSAVGGGRLSGPFCCALPVVLSFCRSVVLSFCRSVVLSFCRSVVLSFCRSALPRSVPAASPRCSPVVAFALPLRACRLVVVRLLCCRGALRRRRVRRPGPSLRRYRLVTTVRLLCCLGAASSPGCVPFRRSVPSFRSVARCWRFALPAPAPVSRGGSRFLLLLCRLLWRMGPFLGPIRWP